MNRSEYSQLPFLVAATIVASLAIGGTFVILVIEAVYGRPLVVPDWLPPVITAVSLAYFGSGPFSAALAHVRALGTQAGQTNAQLIDLANHSLATQRETVDAIVKVGMTTTPAGTGTNETSGPSAAGASDGIDSTGAH